MLALHGDGFGDELVRLAVDQLRLPVVIVRCAGDKVLGCVLNAASAAAGGTLLTKMDDDDLYGHEHVWDLVLAREYSGAHRVGKCAEKVYLARSGRTLQRYLGGSETFDGHASLAGPAMLVSRDDLDTVGGWRELPRRVDPALIRDVRACGGGATYRTHGASLLWIRHGHRHAFDAGDDYFLAHADAAYAGWRPSLAGIVDADRLDVGCRRVLA